MTDQTNTIPKGWKMTTLGEVVEFQRGFDLPTQNRIKGKYPLIASTGIDGFVKDFKVIAPGVVTGRSGSLGKVLFIKENFWPLNTTLWIKDFKGSDKKFIYYWLLRFPFEKYNAGTGVPTLNRNHIHQIGVFLPESPEEQRAIAEVLSSFDDKIELLREQNKTLEATAQTIFKEWFVNFNFPDADSKPYKTSGGKMIDSELGTIPEGWKIGKLGDIFKIEYGKSDKKFDEDGSFPVYGAGGIVGYSNSTNYQGYQVIVGCRGTCGNITLSYEDSKITHNSLVITNEWFKPFSYLFLQIIDIKRATTGSTQPQITIGDLGNIEIYIPGYQIIKLFSENIKSIFEKIRNNNSQIQTLSKIRDKLLPKLMKGEVRVKGFND